MALVLINATGRKNLIDWLGGILAEPQNAAAHADALIAAHDGSDPDATQTVEVRGFDTASGNPETYAFDPAELDLVQED